MPLDTSIKSVLVIGSGPIVIGQACEFDYSGTQACRVLRAEGIRVVLVNSNPATIMTDPEFADATYIEPITQEFIERIIAKERPDAVLATLGGQTALNAAIALFKAGTLERYGVRLIGADVDAIERGENREIFRTIVEKVGGESAKSVICHTMDEVLEAVKVLNYPVVVRPSFTMGGLGSGIAFNEESLHQIAGAGLRHSPTSEVLLEESIIGWKEYELEVMRDSSDNVVIVCSIENIDPMGVHTGDSITVAPAMTLSDTAFQDMRNKAMLMMRSLGNFSGGCNVQFAQNPETEELIAVEINPRVSRSSALASKATGYPIAKIAAKLAIGYHLDELKNQITQTTSAYFEPALDYVIVKIPRWNFDKFKGANDTLGLQMKSVGEVMAIGRSFTEAIQKACQSLENEAIGLGYYGKSLMKNEELMEYIKTPKWDRIFRIKDALMQGSTVRSIAAATGIDNWFLYQIRIICDIEKEIAKHELATLPTETLKEAKKHGFSDLQIAKVLQGNVSDDEVYEKRKALGITRVYKMVDTCAAEFEAKTPYFYSTFEN